METYTGGWGFWTRVKSLGVIGVGERTANIRMWGNDESRDVMWREKGKQEEP